MLTEDYKELTHETVFLKLPITSNGFENTFLLVWTTTPWTVPANVAVGVNVNFSYSEWKNKKTNEKIFILDSDGSGISPKRTLKNKEIPLEQFIFGEHLKDFEKSGKSYKGDSLLGLTYEAPFDGLPIVLDAKKENPKTFHTIVD